jgi:hypothetical protein
MSRDTSSRCALVPLGSAAIRSIGGTGTFNRRQTPAKPELGTSRQRAPSVESEMGEASPRMPGPATERGPFSPTLWSFSRKRPGAYRETTSSWRGATRSRARLSKGVRERGPAYSFARTHWNARLGGRGHARPVADLRAAPQTGPVKAQGLRPLCGLVCGPVPLFRDPWGWAQRTAQANAALQVNRSFYGESTAEALYTEALGACQVEYG